MTSTTLLDDPPDLGALDPDDIVDGYHRLGLADLSDGQLTSLVARSIARPKVAEASSFLLHAPLELLARTALLPLVAPASREHARQRIAWLGATYEAAGEPVRDAAPTTFDSPATAAARLAAAIGAGELDEADSAATWLASSVGATELAVLLAPVVLPHLGAAGHGNIALYLLPRVSPRDRSARTMVRGLVRELARHPDWVLTWHRSPPLTAGSGEVADLIERLRRPESPGDPGSTSIHPTMAITESSGLAAALLAGPAASLTAGDATSALLRVAAWSMLQDDPAHAPYGWSHTLTMPQAALALAGRDVDRPDAIAVAATYVLGFRSTQGSVTLDPRWDPDPPGPGTDVLDASPEVAAAAVWHRARQEGPRIVARLATRAAVHPDAHLAKYTLACLDAAATDPAAGRLYLAAAAYLGAWWHQRGTLTDPAVGS